MERRKSSGYRYSGASIFSNKVKCGECGGWYGSKICHSNDKYRKTIYRCNRKYSGDTCQAPHLTEEEIKAAFVSAFNRLLSEKDEVIANAKIIRQTLCLTDELEAERKNLADEMTVLDDMAKNHVAVNARIVQDQDEYTKRFDELLEKYEAAKKRYDELAKAILDRERMHANLTCFIDTLKAHSGVITKFDAQLWCGMVDFMTVGRDKTLTVRFKGSSEFTA